jgi:hypothetical protein
LFVDGDHSAVGIRGDVRKFWPWLQSTGGVPALCAVHDARPGASGIRAVIEAVEELQQLGVAREMASAGSLVVLEKRTELPDDW